MDASRSVPELRPLGLGEILDAAFRIYKAHFRTLFLCVLFIVVPLGVLTTLLTLSVDPGASGSSADTTLEGPRLAAFAITLIPAVLLSTLATAACTRAVAAAYLGRPVDWRESLRFGFRKVVPLIAVTILTLLAVLGGLVLLVLPGIYLGVRLFLAAPALVVEDESATGAMGRSWALVADRWWATFGVILVSSVLILVIGGILQALITAPASTSGDSRLLGAILDTIGTIVGNIITIPLQAAVLTILYFDLRVRKEGFDLALLSHGVGDPERPEETPPG